MNFKFPSIWLIFAISLIIRLFISFYGTWVGYDEINFYKTGLAFWNDFTIPPRGQVIVYTGAHIPGSLQPVLLGSLYFLSKGEFWIIPTFIAFINTFAAYLIYILYHELFPKFNKVALASFIALTPWSLANVKPWNPSFLPFLSIIFFIGLVRYLKDNSSTRASFLMTASMMAAFQFNLSAVLLFGIFFIGLAVKKRLPSIKGAILGAMLPGIFLIPLIFAPKENVNSVFQFNLDHLVYIFKVLTRSLGFITPELSHFFTKGRILGFPHYEKTIVSVILYSFSIICTLFILFHSIKFYSLRRLKCLLSFNWKDKNIYQKLDAILLVLPVMAGCSFIFSIKGPSSHTIWILYPFAFYPLLRIINESYPNILMPQKLKKRVFLLSSYILLSVSYTIYGSYYAKKLAPRPIDTPVNPQMFLK